jgi:SAM-dependent methyltransferase
MNLYKNTARFYDYLNRLSNEELSFYYSFIKSKYKILNLGCGTGRLTIELIKYLKKCDFDCVDLSDQMLEIFNSKINQYENQLKRNTNVIKLFKEDMLKFESDRKYHLIIFPLQSIQCLPRSLIKEQLRKASLLLEKKGKIIITVFDTTRYGLNKDHKERLNGFNFMDNSFYYSFQSNYNLTEDSLSYSEIVKHYDDQGFLVEESQDEFCIGNVDYNFIINIDHDLDIKIENIYSNFNKMKYQEGDRDCIIVFRN